MRMTGFAMNVLPACAPLCCCEHGRSLYFQRRHFDFNSIEMWESIEQFHF